MLNSARDEYNQSMDLRTKIGEKGTAAETQLALASLLVDEGHADQVMESLRNVKEEFHKDGLGDDEILANIMSARALLAQGKVADAQKAIAGVPDLLAKSQDFSVRLRASIIQAQVEAAGGKYDMAVHGLQTTIANATKSGYLGLQFEAQLALGQMQIAAGEVAVGQSLLSDVAARAQERGFQLIASKAASAKAAKTK
jgi:predicted negative regulator of RcsB-dependent stress response